MNFLRHLLLAIVLIGAQLAASAHAVEHLVPDEGGLPRHACELCLSAQSLGAAAPTPTLSLAPCVAGFARPETPLGCGRMDLPAPPACQRAPPQS